MKRPFNSGWIRALPGLVLLLGLALAPGAAAAQTYVPQPGDYMDTSAREKVDCAPLIGDKTMVAVVFGQSNSANHGQTLYTPRRAVYNFFQGKCYKAQDPLLGATGDKGSVWSRLADKLIENGLYDTVLLVPIGVGGTKVERWTQGADLNLRVQAVISQLNSKHIRITHMLWHQGESDAITGTPGAEYKKLFLAMVDGIRARGVDAPIYVAVATLCGGAPVNYQIQQAQKELVDTKSNIFPGPDTDQLDSITDRPDSCHFTASGLDKHADLWLNAIRYSTP